MATSLIASSTAAGTANVTVVAGTPATIFLNSGSAGVAPPSDAKIVIEIQNAGAVFSWVGELNQANTSRSITSPGTYRVSKTTSGTAYGCDQG